MSTGFGEAYQQSGSTHSLYRKYRSMTFKSDEYVGQEHITTTLLNAIERDRLAHAYLFCGPRGTGKTSTARLLAKAVNCLDPDIANRPCNECAACVAINSGAATDVVEIDAASNRGIDDMRELRERVNFAPVQLRTKFYIIDEAHQVTRDAFNAFLKTLEEPPANTIFVLVTTDPEKLPETIASRCQRFDFRRFAVGDIIPHLRRVADHEGIAVDEEVLALVARRATGSMRDALSTLDMLSSVAGSENAGNINLAQARQLLGIADDGLEYDLVSALADEDVAAALKVVQEVVDSGQDTRAFTRKVTELLRLVMLKQAGADPVGSNDNVVALSERFTLSKLLLITRQFADVDFRIRTGAFPQLPLELAIVGSLVGGDPRPTLDEPRRQAARPAGAEPQRQAPRRLEERQAPTSSQWGGKAPAGAPPPDLKVVPSTQSRASEPPPVDASGEQILERVQQNWSWIKREVKANDVRVAAMLDAADPASVADGAVTFSVAYAFHMDRLSNRMSIDLLQQALRTVIGVDLLPVFKLVSEGDNPNQPQPIPFPPQNRPAPTPVVARDPVDSADTQVLESPAAPPAQPSEDQDQHFERMVKATFNGVEVTDPRELAQLATDDEPSATERGLEDDPV